MTIPEKLDEAAQMLEDATLGRYVRRLVDLQEPNRVPILFPITYSNNGRTEWKLAYLTDWPCVKGYKTPEEAILQELRSNK